jgi:hypothetical protein
MTFRIGQKVVCVAENPSWKDYVAFSFPRMGEVYTVRSIGPAYRSRRDESEGLCIRLNEIRNRPAGCGEEPNFLAARFRPVIERKTDISVFTEILRKASKPARGPAVTSPHGATP